MTTQITIDRDGVQIECVCEWQYHRGCRGHRDKYGAPEEPDEDPELELISCAADGVDIDLSDKELQEAEESAWEELSDHEIARMDEE